MRQKTPKSKSDPTPSKQPRTIVDPAAYKDHNPSWQLGLLDFEGEWGIYAHAAKINFSMSESLIKLVYEKEDIFNAFDKVDKEKFESPYQLTRKFQNSLSSERHIPVECLPEIMLGIKHYYFHREIYPKLKDYEALTWHEVERQTYGGKQKTKNHTISVANLKPAAKKRLKELQLDDIDELFSLRLDGSCRIYGIRKASFLQVIWIDDDHSAYDFD